MCLWKWTIYSTGALPGAAVGRGIPAAVKTQLWRIPSVRNPATNGGASPGREAVPGATGGGADPGGEVRLEPLE